MTEERRRAGREVLLWNVRQATTLLLQYTAWLRLNHSHSFGIVVVGSLVDCIIHIEESHSASGLTRRRPNHKRTVGKNYFENQAAQPNFDLSDKTPSLTDVGMVDGWIYNYTQSMVGWRVYTNLGSYRTKNLAVNPYLYKRMGKY